MIKSLCAIKLDYPTGHLTGDEAKLSTSGKKGHLNDLVIERLCHLSGPMTLGYNQINTHTVWIQVVCDWVISCST